MRDLEAELALAVRTLKMIAKGTASNGVPWPREVLMTDAMDCLYELQQMQFAADAGKHDKEDW